MSVIDKLRRSAQSERELGNVAAAANFERKISELECKHHGTLVSVQPTSDAMTRREVERRWEAIDPAVSVIVLCIEPGVNQAIRREIPMHQALPLLKAEKARLLGLTTDTWVNVQATTSNTPALSTGKGTGICYL